MVDFIIAGAGHNSLITACYLAKAGFTCNVIDARHIPGGGCATEEVLGDGYKIDTCSTGHTLILQNPIISQDELGLVEEFGLSYLHPDPVAHVAFPDGEQITMTLDPNETAEEFSRYSRKDADSYLRLIREFDELKPMLGRARSQPLGMGPSLKSLLEKHNRGAIWLRRQSMSAKDVILREFESKHVRAFMGWMSFQTAVPIDQAGTGFLPYQITAPRQARSWSIPKGGSGKLTEALVDYLEKRGVNFYLGKSEKPKIAFDFWIAFFIANIFGFLGYIIYPAAPPWYYFEYGNELINTVPCNAAGLARFDDMLGINMYRAMYSQGTNTFGAIPSMHAAFPLLLVYYSLKFKNHWLTALFTLSLIGIWFGAVYSAHHYVIDMILGIVCGILGLIITELLVNRKFVPYWYKSALNFIR